MRANRQCVHRCSQGAQCGRTRCRARTQSAGPRHCNTTVPATQAATLQRDKQQRVQQTHQAAHVPSAITPQHLRCLPFELSTEQRGSRRKLRGLDDVRHIAHAVSPGAHRRRTVSWRAGLTPRALRANPACMRPPSACALQRAPSGQLKCALCAYSQLRALRKQEPGAMPSFLRVSRVADATLPSFLNSGGGCQHYMLASIHLRISGYMYKRKKLIQIIELLTCIQRA